MKLISCEKLEKSMVELGSSLLTRRPSNPPSTPFSSARVRSTPSPASARAAPQAMIEKMYGKDLFQYDAINDLFPRTTRLLVKKPTSTLSAVPMPRSFPCLEDEGATLKVKVAVKPEVELGEYAGLTVNKDVKTVDEADVDAEIKRMQDRNGRLLTREGAAENGDTVDIDFEGFVDGVAFDGGKA